MALRRAVASATVGLTLVCGLLGGCSTGPGASSGGPSSPATKASNKGGTATPGTEQVAVASDWEAFSQTAGSLRKDIAQRAEAIRSGPVGNRAVELASLRMTASAFDLIEDGSLGAAVPALQRSISLYGANGYAYLFLAYIHQVKGQAAMAGEFAANAARLLPKDRAVRAELAGLQLAIRNSEHDESL